MLSPLTEKQEIFCLKFIELNNGTQAAIEAGYSPKTAKVIASENLTKPDIKARIAELREKTGLTEDNTIATVKERKQILTEISRGRLADFITGVTPEKLKSAALKELKVTEFVGGKEGRAHQKTTTVQLHNPIAAITELNKMDGVYREGMTVNIDNRKLEITVQNEDSVKLLKEIEEGKAPHGE